MTFSRAPEPAREALEPAPGIEPGTNGLQNRCSTAELCRPRRAGHWPACGRLRRTGPGSATRAIGRRNRLGIADSSRDRGRRQPGSTTADRPLSFPGGAVLASYYRDETVGSDLGRRVSVLPDRAGPAA